MKFVKNEHLKENPNFFTNYESKRDIGENDSYICSLICQDLVEDFITYVNCYSISALSEISPSFFETNPFLIDTKNPTLIEYSVFFGSIHIFRYLFHLLESNKVQPLESKRNKIIIMKYITHYEQCLIECHHNDIDSKLDSKYIQNQMLYKLRLIMNKIRFINYRFKNIELDFEYILNQKH